MDKYKYETETMLFDITRTGAANAKSMILDFSDEIDRLQANSSNPGTNFALYVLGKLKDLGAEVSYILSEYLSASAAYLENCEDFWDKLYVDFTKNGSTLKSVIVEFKYKGTWDVRGKCYYWTAMVPTVIKREYK